MWKKLVIGVGAAALLGWGGYLGYWQLVKHGHIRYNEYDRRERGALRAGDPAPDLALTGYDGATVQLSSLWKEKPLFLVFGSCT